MTRSRTRAFTLIEVLIVIGIIILLAGILVYGVSKVMEGSKAASTKATLENLRSMLSEYETVSKGLKRQPPIQFLNDGDAGATSIWQDADPSDTNSAPEPDPAQAPRDVTQAAGTGPSGRYTADQIGNTQQVLMLMLQAPSVRTMMSQLPAQQMMEQIPAGLAAPPAGVKLWVQRPNNTVGPYQAVAARPSPPLVLDAWGNPIIFVPGGGLAGGSGADAMYVGGKAGDTNAVQVMNNLDPATTPPANQRHPIRSPDNRPFWASAGPDGNFLTGDDNLYSFEN